MVLALLHFVFFPRCIGHLCPILNLKCFNLCTNLPSDKSGFLFNRGIMLFLLISRMLIYIVLLLGSPSLFMFCLQHKPYQWRVFAIWAGYGPYGFILLAKPILFLCNHKVLCVIIYLDDILVLTHSKHAG